MTLFSQDLKARKLAQEQWPIISASSEVLEATREGKMFGLLFGEAHSIEFLSPSALHHPSYLDKASNLVTLFACSGQLNGVWEPQGWAPSLLNHQKVAGSSWRTQRDLHRITQKLRSRQVDGDLEKVSELKQMRRFRSQSHARELLEATTLISLKGQAQTLYQFWPEASVGVGECCAPKLICWAAQLSIKPLGLAEFRFISHQQESTFKPPRASLIETLLVSGGELRFFAPCEPRCQPILPFLINGIDLKL